MLIDWLAAGLNPGVSTLFVQSHVPEHAELHLLLSMVTPLGWLERVPTYKDQQEELKEKDLATYGFLGYPLLQTADILIYRPAFVPVGEDQVAHVEITREIARRFNHLYGREPDFETKAENAIKSFGGRNSTHVQASCARNSRKPVTTLALDKARNWSRPTRASRWPTANACWVTWKAAASASCPSRRCCSPRRRKCRDSTDARCPSPTATPLACGRPGSSLPRTQDHADRPCASTPHRSGQSRITVPCSTCTRSIRVRRPHLGSEWMRTAGIGCIECKRPVIERVVEEIARMRERARPYIDNPELVRNIVDEGGASARRRSATLDEVRRVMNLRVD